MREKTARKHVFKFHNKGLAVPEIAKEMQLDHDVVRDYIVDAWFDDKEEARIESAVKGR